MKRKYLENRKNQIFKNRKVISLVFIACMFLDLILATIDMSVLQGIFFGASILILLVALIPLWCHSTLGIFTSATLISIYTVMSSVLQSLRLVSFLQPYFANNPPIKVYKREHLPLLRLVVSRDSKLRFLSSLLNFNIEISINR